MPGVADVSRRSLRLAAGVASVKVPRAGRELPEERAAIDEPPGDHVHDAVLVLQLAVHLEQPRLDERATLRLADALPNDDVHLAALVLERDEGDAARGGGPLTHEHDAGGAYRGTVRGAAELARTQERVGAQPLAQQRERMPAERESHGSVVGADFLALGRLLEQGPALRETRALARAPGRGGGQRQRPVGSRGFPEPP